MTSVSEAAAPFITFEGGEGAGKSTQIQDLAQFLRDRGMEVRTTREPGGTPAGERLRAQLLSPDEGGWSGMAETLLMNAARVEHIRQVILPERRAGTWVLCDRFHDSTAAYQGAGQGVDTALIECLNDHVLAGEVPDLTIILDVPAEIGLQRAQARAEAQTRFEGLDTAFHARVRQAFLDIAQTEPERCVVVDATATPEAVSAEIIAEVRRRFADRLTHTEVR